MPLKYDFKAFPLNPRHPAFPKEDFVFRPILKAVIWHSHQRTTPVECILDTGSDYCLFHAAVGRAVGIDIARGIAERVGGIAKGMKAEFFFHKVKLVVAGSTVEVMAGFSDDISVAGILGHRGFFDNFIVTFDYTPHPPSFEVQQILRN